MASDRQGKVAAARTERYPLDMTKPAKPFRYFNSSPEVIRLVVMMYVKHPLSLRNVLRIYWPSAALM